MITVGIALLIFSAIFFMMAYLPSKESDSFENNYKYANGIVESIVPIGGGWYKPIVRITDEFGVSQKLTCHGIKMSEEIYKSLMGATVRISYSGRTTSGVTMWDAFVNDDRFNAPRASSVFKVLAIIGAVLLIVSVMLIITSIHGAI